MFKTYFLFNHLDHLDYFIFAEYRYFKDNFFYVLKYNPSE